MMDYIITKADKPNWYQFYPTEQPDGDFDTDHHPVWMDERVRADFSDRILCMLLENSILLYSAGAPLPLPFGKVSVDFDRGKIIFDWAGDDGFCPHWADNSF